MLLHNVVKVQSIYTTQTVNRKTHTAANAGQQLAGTIN